MVVRQLASLAMWDFEIKRTVGDQALWDALRSGQGDPAPTPGSPAPLRDSLKQGTP